MDSSAGDRPTELQASETPDSTLPPAALQAMAAARPANAPKRCFICLTDEDMSDPPGSWVDPCPCTLEAHQDCMLSWVTDCERSNKELRCPVCKSYIEMEGPWDPVLALSDIIRDRFTKASPFVLFTSVSMGVQFSLQMYGAMALWTFSGKDTLLRFMLGPNLVIDGRGSDGIRFAKERIWNALILMNVAPALLGGQLLPSLSNKIFLPTASLYGIYHILHDDEFFGWPPSPQLAMAVFPYIRSVYHSLWRELVLPYEVKLNRQIMGLPAVESQGNEAGGNNRRNADRNAEGGIIAFLQTLVDAIDPDDGDQADDGGAAIIQVENEAAEGEGQDNDEEVVVEVVIEGILNGNDEPAAENNAPDEPMQDQPNVAPLPVDNLEAAERPDHHLHDQGNGANMNEPLAPGLANQQGQREQHEAPQAPPARRLGLGAILSNVSNAIVSALILPGISFVVGEALRLVLPKTWTATMNRSPWMRYGSAGRPGLLQQQWGRSLVGGCLYVVLKDAMRVYTKSRKVAAMTNRKVKNVERPRRKSEK